MSRVTPPVNKASYAARSIVRSMSSSSSAARQSALVDRQRPSGSNGSKQELADRLENDSRAFHTVRRPSPQIPKTIPLMQGFRTSSPKPAAHDSSTIDFVFFPEVPEAPPANPFARLRVPLLPDNYNPDRSANSAHMVETLDPAVPSPEIHIVASHPHNVPVVAPMSEVVGNDAIELDIARLAAGFSSSKASKEPSVLKEVLGGLVDDIFGTKKSPKVAM